MTSAYRVVCFAAMAAATVALSLAADETPAAAPTQQQLPLLKTFVEEFIDVTPGKGKFSASFQMGSASGADAERPVHKVTFDYDFAIAKYEVPQNLYEAVMGENPSRWKGPRNSAEMMTYDEANAFCRKVTDLLRSAGLIKPTEVIRLPSEAEWEYCCRAGTETDYSFGPSATKEGDKGNQASILDEYAWHTGNAAGNDPPVGALKPNPWGLYDVHGYLWEFVSDAWHDDYRHAPADGRSWSDDEKDAATRQFVIRGGSWQDRYEQLRSSARRKASAAFHSDAVGFRCVKSNPQ